MEKLCYFGYNTYGTLTTFTTGTAGTTILQSVLSFPVQTQFYAVSMSIGSASVPASTPGIAILRKQTKNSGTVGTTAIAWSDLNVDILLNCVAVPTTLGVVGQDKIIFGRKDQGIIANTTDEFGLYFYSQTAGISLSIMVLYYTMPIIGGQVMA